MLSIYRNADIDYIKKLLVEMKDSEEITYKLHIKEERINGDISFLQITADEVQDCGF